MKKILSIILISVILSSIFIFPSAVHAVSAYNIDTSKTGTLKIHAYEMRDVSDAVNIGTGNATIDAPHVASSAVPLNGVTYSVYKIATLNEYYKSDGKALPTVKEARSMTKLSTSTTSATVNGVTTLSNLQLGIYYVKPKSIPYYATAQVSDFVVSIPTTKNTTSSTNTEWLYTVDVYPKNEIQRTNINLEKRDERNNEPLAGAEFTLTLLSPDSWTEMTSAYTQTVTTNSDGEAQFTNVIKRAYYKLTETKAPTSYILNNANENNIKYIYIDTNGRICDKNSTTTPINAATPDTIVIYNTKPEIEKYIDKSDGQNTSLVTLTTIEHTSSTDYNYYTIAVTTPNIAMSNLDTFTVQDYVYGGKTGVSPVVTSVTDENGNSISNNASGWTSSCSATGGNTNGMTPYLLSVTLSTAASTQIKADTTYYISMRTFSIDVSNNTTNECSLLYTSNISTSAKTTIHSKQTTLRTSGIKLQKQNSAGTNLSGTQWKLYKSLSDAQNGTNPVSAFNDSTNTYTNTFTSNSTGLVGIRYLSYGGNPTSSSKKYYLVETKTPSGYNLLKEPLAVTVNSTSYSNTVTVKNTAIPNTPLTGGPGFIISIALGIILITGVIVSLIIINRRKRSKQS